MRITRTDWDRIDDPASLVLAAGLPEPNKPTTTIRCLRTIRCRCVYFVWNDEKTKIVYIGKTCNLQSRMQSHHKGFSGNEPMSIIVFNSEGRESIAELIYIAAYMPEMNQVVQEASVSPVLKLPTVSA